MAIPKYFREVTDCSNCPFHTDYEMYAFRCNSDPNYNCPCMNMEEYGDMTISEVSRAVIQKVQNSLRDDLEMMEIEEDIRQKREDKRRKANETRAMNYDINIEISALRKGISKREKAIRAWRSMCNVISMSNDIMSGGINTVLPNDPPQVIEWVNQNRDAQKKIEELVLLRKARNSENRRRSNAVKKKGL